jgi:hypothetical protein
MTRRKILVGIATAVIVVIALLIFEPFSNESSKPAYLTLPSPDRRFRIVIYRAAPWWRRWVMAGPGQGSDAPGLVCLYEVATGKRLERKRVEMLQMIGFSEITWSATNVHITLFADWKLPGPRNDR